MKVPGPGLIRISTLRYFFPCESFDVEHVNVCDHPPFCNETTSLDEMRRVRICLVSGLSPTYR